MDRYHEIRAEKISMRKMLDMVAKKRKYKEIFLEIFNGKKYNHKEMNNILDNGENQDIINNVEKYGGKEKIKNMIKDYKNLTKKVNNFEPDLMKVIQVFRFFESKILLFWNKTKKWIKSMDLNSLSEEYTKYTNSKYIYKYDRSKFEEILDNLDNYESEILSKLKRYYEDTIENESLQYDIFSLIIKISKIRCGDMTISGKTLYGPNYYYLISDTGSFAFNTWFYAYFNHVDIIGVPYGLSEADGDVYCPSGFIFHDLTHMESFHKYRKDAKIIYEKIIKDDLNKSIKEILIFGLWLLVHEYGYDFKNRNQSFDYNLYDFFPQILKDGWFWIIDYVYPSLFTFYPSYIKNIESFILKYPNKDTVKMILNNDDYILTISTLKASTDIIVDYIKDI